MTTANPAAPRPPNTPAAPSPRARITPWRSVAILTAAIFFVELSIMGLFFVLPELPPLLGAVFDAVSLVVVVSPVLYLFSLRPILQTLNHLQEAEDTILQFSHQMEQAVAERTRDLALAAEVGQSLASVRDVEALLAHAAESVRARFDLEYAQIYLTDLSTHALVLRSGTGEVGAELLRRHQRLPIGAGSLNGLAVVEHRPVIVEDTHASAQFRPNPLLPNIRSEMVIPLIVSEQVVGTLDLQSTRPGALTAANLPAFEALAGQLAAAIQNAELFGMLEKARAAVVQQTRRTARAGWENFLNAVERSEHFGYAFAEGQLSPLDAADAPAANQPLLTAPLSISGEPVGALQLEGDPDVPWTADEAQLVEAIARQTAQQLENLRLLAEAEEYQQRAEEAVRRLTREGWQTYETQASQPGFLYDANQIIALPAAAPMALPDEYHGMELMQPLTVRGEGIGELAVGGLEALNDEAAELVNAVADKLSAHLESLRLFEQTQSALARAQALYEMGRELMAAEQMGDLLCNMADRAARALPADRVLAMTFDVDERAVRYFARSGLGLEDASGVSFDGLWNGLSGWALREARPALSFKDTPDPREDAEAQKRRRDDQCGSIVVVPLQLRGKALGTLTAINRPDQRDFTVNDVELLEAMANQVAVALDNRHLFEQTQAALVNTEALYQATADFAGARSYDDILAVLNDRTLMGRGSHLVGIGFFDRPWTEQQRPNTFDVQALQLRVSPELAARVPRHFAFSAMPYQRLLRAGVITAMEDLDTDPLFTAADRELFHEMFEARAFIFAPIVVRGQLIGVINALYPHVTEFPESDLRQLTTLASQAAVALDNLRSLEQTQRALTEAELLYNASRRIAAATDYQEILAAVVGSVPNRAVNRAMVLSFEHDGAGELERAWVAANWHTGSGTAPAPVGTTYAKADFESLPLLSSAQAVFLDDIAADPRIDPLAKEILQRGHIRSAAVLPLWVGTRQLGVLTLQADDPHPFTEAEMRPYRSLAQQMAVAFENRRLFEQTQAALGEAAQLYGASRRLASADDVQTMVATVVEGVPISAISRARLLTLERDAERRARAFRVIAQWGRRPEDAAAPVGQEYALEGTLLQWMLGAEPLFVTDCQTDLRLDETTRLSLQPTGLRAAALFPLWVGGEQTGGLLIESDEPHEFVDNEIRPYRSLAQQLAVAVENRRLFDQTQASLAEQIRVTAQLETVNEVTTATATLLEPTTLLQTVVDLTKARFNLYHAHIYLLNDLGDELRLTAGAGVVGRQMVAEGRHISLRHAHSLVARAARTRQSAAANDVQAEPDFLPHPLLPDTRAELAVPMMAGDKVLGVFDVQANRVNYFTEEAMRVQLTLATQVAVALQNAASFAEIGAARTQLEAQARRLTREGWGDFLNAVEHAEHLGYAYDLASVTPLLSAPAASASQNVAAGLNVAAAPLMITGERLGALRVEADADRTWGGEEIAIVNAVAQRLAQHVENLRLLDQAQRYRAEAEQAIRRLTHEGWDAYAPAVAETGFVYDQQRVTLLASDGNPVELLRGNGHPPHAHTQALKVRGETIGQLAVDGVDLSDPAQAELMALVAERLSAHIENLRLLDETQKRAAELETVAKVSATASATLEAELLLQMVVDLTKERFHLYHAHVYVLDEATETLVLMAGAGQVGAQMVAEGRPIPLAWEQSLVARAARLREPVVANDVRLHPDFMPHPLLPETRAELAVPMVVSDKVLGVFDVQADRVNYFTDEDVRIQTTLAAQVAVALHNANLYADQSATVTRLRELDHLKSSFLANMSHELRTPLNSILGFTEVILEELDGPLTDQMGNDLKIVYKNGQHLLNLINDVLDMAKIESGKLTLNPERFDLTEVLEEVIGLTSSLARTKDIELKLDAEVGALELDADRMRLRQVFINLVNNAIKFTDRGFITIAAVHVGDHIRASVHDTGLGIPADHLETVFQEFTQVDTTTTRKVGGTGLGLPISRHLVTMHGGRLWAESTGIAGEGSTFIMELPVNWPGVAAIEE